jgi:uncharacterized membrane protein YgcG
MGVERDRALEEALEQSFRADPPHSARERALFVQAVAARRVSFSTMRFVAPAVAVAAAFVLVALVSTTTLPGDDLYGVRTALSRVGLVESALEEADGYMASAAQGVAEAEAATSPTPLRARRLAVAALGDLGSARHIATEAGAEDRLDAIADLEDRAVDVIEDVAKAEAGEDSGGDDNSGPGGGDSGGDDSSGPGGGDDSSGPGGGDDPGGEDSSGPGSGDSGGDSSGPGGGGDSGGDSSGPGGGDSSGSGGDSSGPGGGDSSGSSG